MLNRESSEDLRRIFATPADRITKAKRAAETIRTAGAYRWVGIYDVDVRRGLVSNIAWSGPSAPAYPEFPATKGLTARAIAGKKTVNVGDVVNDPGYLTALDSTRAEIIVPVFLGSDVVGTLDVESEYLNAFDSRAQTLLEECAQILRGLWTAGI
jgi:L-methionine (R)-S-oxide reductase